MMALTKALVILSGGQDSTTCLFWAKQHFQIVRALTFNYGQRHKAELASAIKVAELAEVEHDVVHVPGILKSRSPLVDFEAELETYNTFEEMDKIIGERVELTFVPMRNAFFITLAANIAAYYSIFDLVTGVCQADNANYPDCRLEFIQKQRDTINSALGLHNVFTIHAPLMMMQKAESIKFAKEIPGCWEALGYSHTCYAGKVPPCGECHACVLRAHGFEEAGFKDPLIERLVNASA